jgi:hypothetical protein
VYSVLCGTGPTGPDAKTTMVIGGLFIPSLKPLGNAFFPEITDLTGIITTEAGPKRFTENRMIMEDSSPNVPL